MIDAFSHHIHRRLDDDAMPRRHERQLVDIHPNGAVSHLLRRPVRNESDEGHGELGFAGVPSPIAKRGDLLQSRRRRTENATRQTHCRLIRRLLEPRRIPREQPSVSRARIRRFEKQNGQRTLTRRQQHKVDCGGQRTNRWPRNGERTLTHDLELVANGY